MLDPEGMLATLVGHGVDFVVVGALAVGFHGYVRATGDVDVMVPAGDEDNRTRLEAALKALGAEKLPAVTQGGLPLPDDDPYPTLQFRTRCGRLDILYRPDGSAPYATMKGRSAATDIAGVTVHIASVNDVIAMKLAAGRSGDLDDVAAISSRGTALPRVERTVSVALSLAPAADPQWVCDLLRSRLLEFDDGAEVWVEDARLSFLATREDLTADQLRQWAQALAHRLRAADLLTDNEAEIRIA